MTEERYMDNYNDLNLFKSNNMFNSMDLSNSMDVLKCKRAENNLGGMKTMKCIDNLLKNINPMGEIYKFINGQSHIVVGKINWSGKDLYESLYHNKESLYVPLGKIESVCDSCFYMDDNYQIFLDSDDYPHNSGSYGLIVSLYNDQLEFKYAYSENQGEISLGAENCTFTVLDLPQEGDYIEDYIFNSLRNLGILNS